MDVVLGLLVLAGLVWFFFFRDSGESRGQSPTANRDSSYTGRSTSSSSTRTASRRTKPYYAVMDLETSALRPNTSWTRCPGPPPTGAGGRAGPVAAGLIRGAYRLAGRFRPSRHERRAGRPQARARGSVMKPSFIGFSCPTGRPAWPAGRPPPGCYRPPASSSPGRVAASCCSPIGAGGCATAPAWPPASTFAATAATSWSPLGARLRPRIRGGTPAPCGAAGLAGRGGRRPRTGPAPPPAPPPPSVGRGPQRRLRPLREHRNTRILGAFQLYPTLELQPRGVVSFERWGARGV